MSISRLMFWCRTATLLVIICVWVSCRQTKWQNPVIVDSIGVMKNGKQHGKWNYWMAGGKIAKTGYFDNGRQTGQWILFDVNGDTSVVSHYCQGVLHGKFVSWSGGKLYTIAFYKNGDLDGPMKSYHPNGKVNSEDFSTNGKSNGISSVYDSSGQLIQQGRMINSRMKGKWLEWNATKKRMDTVVYDQ